jgi:hypothetical protein
MLSKKQLSYPWSGLSAAAVVATLALSEGTIPGRENLGRSLVNSSLLCRYIYIYIATKQEPTRQSLITFPGHRDLNEAEEKSYYLESEG